MRAGRGRHATVPDGDDHLLKAGYDGCRAKVAKVGNTVAVLIATEGGGRRGKVIGRAGLGRVTGAHRRRLLMASRGYRCRVGDVGGSSLCIVIDGSRSGRIGL